MIILLLIVLIVVGGLAYQKYRGTQALTFTHIDVAGLTLDQILEIGGKASGSLTGRLTRSRPVVRRTGDGAEWQAQIQGSVMTFSAEPLRGTSGYRVGGAATKMRIAQVGIGSNQGIWGLSKAISNAIYRVLGIPHNSPALVRRRKRVLNAIANAGTVLNSDPGQISPEPTNRASA
jgi:hypothetical protein